MAKDRAYNLANNEFDRENDKWEVRLAMMKSLLPIFIVGINALIFAYYFSKNKEDKILTAN